MSKDNFKEKYRRKFSKNPEKFYPARTLKGLGYERGKCSNCGKFFWSTDPERKVCGDSACSGGYSFIHNTPAKHEYGYTEMWEKFSEILQREGYAPIKRYPVSARWREDINFVEASIDDFIPYVVSGEIEPPKNPLIVPQSCLRFNDIDNIGFTGAHYSLFNMIGQHRFEKENYDPGMYLEHLYAWFDEGLGLERNDIIFHEDFWSGSGNFGPCIEFFSGGLELANQVYMQYKRTNSGYEDLNMKVLDMGLGQERNAWFSKGNSNSYEAVFPTVTEFLRNRTGIETDSSIIEKFLPYSSYLNLDEVKSPQKVWERVAKESGVGIKRLEREVKPLAALYSIGDHTRALLIALSDGVLPSNTGGGYNLRVLLRRVMDFVNKYGWEIDILNVIEKHVNQLEGQYPETRESLEEVNEILKHEIEKYNTTRKKAKRIVENLEGENLSDDKLLELYDSKGITPELLEKYGVSVPENFYAKVSERHEEEEKEKGEEEIDFSTKGLDNTVMLYRDDFLTNFNSEVVSYQNSWLALEATVFYPTLGGQDHDKGYIEDKKVFEVRKKEGVILHKVEGEFEEGQRVKGEIDWDRREQLMQHHTATHIINGVSREIFGNHIWQAGAEKTCEKARLDLTHYKNITKDEMEEMERKANDIIEKDLPVRKREVAREKAEEKYGFRIYQGGAVPGKIIRIVEIEDLDVEACGGTHCDFTGEVDKIIITGIKKIQDGVVRVEFKAGKSAEIHIEEMKGIKENLEDYIEVSGSLDEIAEIYSTTVDELPKVIERFIEEWKEQKDKLEELEREVDINYSQGYDKRPRDPEELFKSWKAQKKDIRSLESNFADEKIDQYSEDEREVIIDTLNLELGALIRITRSVTGEESSKALVIKGKSVMVGSSGSENSFNVRKEIEKYAENVEGNENFAKGFKLRGD